MWRVLLQKFLHVIGALAPSCQATDAEPTYAVRVLGMGPGDVDPYSTVEARSVNNQGVAVGRVSRESTRGVYWAPGSTDPIVLQGLPKEPWEYNYFPGQPSAINDSGAMVGWGRRLDNKNSPDRALFWADTSSQPVELPSPPSDPERFEQVSANAISDSGIVVGQVWKYASTGTDIRAIRWNADHTPVELEGLVPNGHHSSRALGVNNGGDVVGMSTKYGGADGNTYYGQRPVRWARGQTNPTELGVFSLVGTAADAAAVAINDSGTAVGWGQKFDGPGSSQGSHRAVKWEADSTLPVLLADLSGISDLSFSGASEAWSISAAGDIVGMSSGSVNGSPTGARAVIWRAGRSTPIDLNTLLPPDSGWYLTIARDINDRGDIVGVGLFDPDGPGDLQPYTRGFFLTAVPEPSAAVVLFPLTLALLSRSRRRPARIANAQNV